MDEQRVKESAKDAAGKIGDAANDFAAQAQANVQGGVDQAKSTFRDLKASAGETVGRATAAARDLSAAGTEVAGQVSEAVQGVAREVGSQVGQAATTVYQQGANAGGYVSRYTAEQPLTALLVAAAVGYGLAYLIHRP